MKFILLIVFCIVGCASNTIHAVSAKTMPRLYHQASQACLGKDYVQVDMNGSSHPETTFADGKWNMNIVCD